MASRERGPRINAGAALLSADTSHAVPSATTPSGAVAFQVLFYLAHRNEA